jgi:hypothetical protein
MKAATLTLPILKGRVKPSKHLKRVTITYPRKDGDCQVELTYIIQVTDSSYTLAYHRHDVNFSRANRLRRSLMDKGVDWISRSSTSNGGAVEFNVSRWLQVNEAHS